MFAEGADGLEHAHRQGVILRDIKPSNLLLSPQGRLHLTDFGLALGILQDGKVVFKGGFGVRTLGQPEAVDADTLFMIASNTKALTTRLLAKLVEDRFLTWETPVTHLLPEFQLGDADTTSRVLVKHLIRACTGMPRQDMEWLLEFGAVTPKGAIAMLASMQPTSKVGELFQYSNLMAEAAGFIAGQVLFPELELGAAYDRAMRQQVFDPLGMNSATFDFARAQSGPHAGVHAPDIDVFTVLNPPPGRSLVSFEPIYSYLEAQGLQLDGEGLPVIFGWPVQFLPTDKPLLKEALEQSVIRSVDGVEGRVFTAEHLAATAFELGRPKDKLRLEQFRERKALHAPKLHEILARHGLLDRWLATRCD
jgi:CubicO group peptidase (beta-lactamase class C family)